MHIWEKFLLSKEAELGANTVNKWLRTLKVLDFDACNLYLEAQDSFQSMWFEEHIRPSIKKYLRNNNDAIIRVHVKVTDAPDSSPSKDGYHITKQPVELIVKDELDPYASFAYFVPYKDNLVSYKLFSELVGYNNETNNYSNPSLTLASFNPIYIYGDSGSGKTHLLMSITAALIKRGYKACFVRAETFTGNMVKAIRSGNMQLFRNAYRNLDILLIDDVHVFSRKNSTQEEFFHTFNKLHVEGKQMIFSSNCAPSELDAIESRLVSRFECGIVLPIKLPNSDVLKEILEKKLKALHFPLQTTVMEFLLKNFSNHPKRFYRALNTLMLRSHLRATASSRGLSKEIDVTQAKKLISDLLKEQKSAALTPDKILQTTANFYGIRLQDILGKSQSRECASPRQIAMYLCRSQLKLPFMKIGDIFSRDHSTVMTSVKNIEKHLTDQDKPLAHAIRTISKQLQY